jgi:hypothetical protein
MSRQAKRLARIPDVVHTSKQVSCHGETAAARARQIAWLPVSRAQAKANPVQVVSILTQHGASRTRTAHNVCHRTLETVRGAAREMERVLHFTGIAPPRGSPQRVFAAA